MIDKFMQEFLSLINKDYISFLHRHCNKNVLQGQKETNLGQPQRDRPAFSSGQALAKSDNWLQVKELDVIVDSRVATCEDEMLSEKSSRNIYHFSREPGGNFIRQNDSTDRYLLLVSMRSLNLH